MHTLPQSQKCTLFSRSPSSIRNQNLRSGVPVTVTVLLLPGFVRRQSKELHMCTLALTRLPLSRPIYIQLNISSSRCLHLQSIATRMLPAPSFCFFETSHSLGPSVMHPLGWAVLLHLHGRQYPFLNHTEC